MLRIEVSPSALGDLDDIFLDGLSRFGLTQAQAFQETIVQTFQRLADQPLMGEDFAHIYPDSRLFRRLPPCRIVYRVGSDTLYILRVFHGRQDYERLMD